MVKKKRLSPKTAYIILGIVFLVMVIALIAQVAAEGKMTSSIAVRTLIPMGACASAFAKIYTGNKYSRGLNFYEKLYEKDIVGAFDAADKKSERRTLLKGIRDFHEDRFESAMRRIEPLLARCTTPQDFATVHFFLGVVYKNLSLLDRAVHAYEAALSHDPNRAAAWNNLGTIALNRGDTDKAATCFREAAHVDKTYVMAYNNMAQLQLRLGRWKDCIPFAAHAIKLKSDLTAAYHALAIAYYALGHRTEGRRYADQAAQHGSNRQNLENIFAALDRGENPFGAYVELSDEIEEALEHFRRRNVRNMLHLCMPAEGSNIGRSRLGGESVGEAPLDSHGKPMRLLAAIWCSETQGMADLPDHGVLRFFIADDRDYGCYRHAPTEQTDFRVLYTPDEDAFGECAYELTLNLHTNFPVKGCFPIWFVPGMSTPLRSDYRFRPLLEEALAKAGAPSINEMDPAMFHAVCEQNEWGGHRLGGYPCFEQIDPRHQKVYQPYDALLLQIVTHQVAYKDGYIDILRFGHDGGCQFFIPREKLRACDFSDVLYWWDDIPEDDE